jgi:hypothetical protein
LARKDDLPLRSATREAFPIRGSEAGHHWINERDANDPDLVHQALVLDADEPLAPVFVAFWQRILAEGCANAATSDWLSLAVEIADRQAEDDSQGWMGARFLNAQRRACAGVGRYYLRSDAFDFIQGDHESNAAFNRREIVWFLAQYQALKDAAQSPEVQALFRRIETIRPLPVNVATANGWFDLQVGQASFGPLPDEDEAMLSGEDPVPTDPLVELVGGNDTMDLLQELGGALIEYTPPHFEVICCRITEGLEQGQRALFYDVSCPQFPDDGTDVVNERVHTVATRLVQQMAPARGSFPGAMIRLELQKDGTWRPSG